MIMGKAFQLGNEPGLESSYYIFWCIFDLFDKQTVRRSTVACFSLYHARRIEQPPPHPDDDVPPRV
jgi:hypothetical protein